MIKVSSRAGLSKALSRVEGFVKPKRLLRQYLTPPRIASDLLWTAFMNKDLAGKSVFDLGCGTGMLTIGAALLGADVTGFDIDPEAIEIAVSNAKKLGVNIVVFEQDIDSVSGSCDTVVMNPPFMVKGGKNDRVFLEKAFSLCNNVYSIHNSVTREWVKRFGKSHGYEVFRLSTHDFPLPREFKHHTKLKDEQRVDLWFFNK